MVTVGTDALPAKVRAFQTCEFCDYDLRTGEGERSCHYYACPYLPEELDVLCPDCRYNVFTGEGDPSCGGPGICEFARTEGPTRVRMLTAWLELQGAQQPAG